MSGQGSGIIPIGRIFAVADQLQRSNLPPHRTLQVVAQGLGFDAEQMAEMVLSSGAKRTKRAKRTRGRKR